MSVLDTDLKPHRVPSGFKFFGIARGALAGEFNDDDGQVVARYRLGSEFELARTLSVCFSPAGRSLNCVEGAKPTYLTIGGLDAQYFDGHWAPGPGPGQQDTVMGPVHWDTTTQHSLQVFVPEVGTVAVRVSPAYAPSHDELGRIAASLPQFANWSGQA